MGGEAEQEVLATSPRDHERRQILINVDVLLLRPTGATHEERDRFLSAIRKNIECMFEDEFGEGTRAKVHVGYGRYAEEVG